MGRIIEDPSVRINGNSSSGNNESNNNISPLLLGSCPVSNAKDFTLSRKNAECFLYSSLTTLPVPDVGQGPVSPTLTSSVTRAGCPTVQF